MASSIEYGELNLYPPTKVLTLPLPDGDKGIQLTIGMMRQAAQYGQNDPQIRQLALDIVRGVPNKDTAGELKAIQDWVRSNIAFRGELDETVQSPEVTIKFMAGDCDDFSVLIAALVGVLGFPWDFKTVALHGEKDFQHVYPIVQDYTTGQWLSLDATVDEAYPGWEPDNVTRSATWRGMGMWPGLRFRGLGSVVWGDRTARPLLGDPTAADQVSQVINAATPLVQAIRARERFDPYSNTYVMNPPPPPPPPPPFPWIPLGLAAALIYFVGQNRGMRR